MSRGRRRWNLRSIESPSWTRLRRKSDCRHPDVRRKSLFAGKRVVWFYRRFALTYRWTGIPAVCVPTIGKFCPEIPLRLTPVPDKWSSKRVNAKDLKKESPVWTIIWTKCKTAEKKLLFVISFCT